MTGLRRLTGLIVCSYLVWAAPAAADPISELNVIAADTIFAGGRPAGAAPLLDFAMVHAAIHDAVGVDTLCPRRLGSAALAPKHMTASLLVIG